MAQQTSTTLEPGSNSVDVPLVTSSQQSVPEFAKASSAVFNVTPSSAQLVVTMKQNVAVNNSQLMIFAHMSDGTVVTACLGQLSIPNFCLSGQAVLSNDMDQVIGTGSVSVSANQVVINLPGDYSTRNCLAVSSSYGAPPSPMEEFFADATGIDLPRGNIGAALASTVFLTNTTSLTIYFPNIGKLVEDALGLAGYLGRRRLNMPRCGIDGVRLDGSHRSLPRTDDINKDGKLDFDGPGLIQIPGSTICVDTRIIDNSPDLDYLVFIYGTDTNNDGTLTGDEIIGLFGRCIWPSASNVSYYQIIDGVLYLIHENNNLNTGETLIFVLNTQTNYLIVKDKNGNTLFQGQATGWSGGGIPQELGK